MVDTAILSTYITETPRWILGKLFINGTYLVAPLWLLLAWQDYVKVDLTIYIYVGCINHVRPKALSFICHALLMFEG